MVGFGGGSRARNETRLSRSVYAELKFPNSALEECKHPPVGSHQSVCHFSRRRLALGSPLFLTDELNLEAN